MSRVSKPLSCRPSTSPVSMAQPCLCATSPGKSTRSLTGRPKAPASQSGRASQHGKHDWKEAGRA